MHCNKKALDRDRMKIGVNSARVSYEMLVVVRAYGYYEVWVFVSIIIQARQLTVDISAPLQPCEHCENDLDQSNRS